MAGGTYRCTCGPGYTLQADKLGCERTKECHINADVVFALDSSGSVTQKSFDAALGIIKEFVRFIEQVKSYKVTF